MLVFSSEFIFVWSSDRWEAYLIIALHISTYLLNAGASYTKSFLEFTKVTKFIITVLRSKKLLIPSSILWPSPLGKQSDTASWQVKTRL